MQMKKAVSLSLATLVVVVLIIATRNHHQGRKPQQERDEFHFVVNAAEWGLHGTKVCMFVGSGLSTPLVTTVGCWDNEGTHDFFNQDDKPNNHLYSVDIDVPKTTQVQLGQGHNAMLYCIRSDWTHLVCDQN